MQEHPKEPNINLKLLGFLTFLYRIKASIIFAVCIGLWNIYYSPNPLIFFSILLLGMLLFQAANNYVSLVSLLVDDAPVQAIPVKKFDAVLDELKTEIVKIERLGFEEIERYYIKRTTYESLVFLFRDRQSPLYWEINHVVGRIQYSTIFSEFESGLYLSSISIAAGHFPRLPQAYLQSLPQADYSTLLELHRDALEIFADYGHTPLDIPAEHFRNHYVNVGKSFIRYILTVPLWYVKMTIWVLTKAGKKYQVPIREQLAKNLIRIPHNS